MTKILVADDEPDIRMLARIALKSEGFTVLEAENGEDTLTAIIDQDPDLVFLDLRMPGLDGWSVLERLKAEGRLETVPVVIISAHAGLGSTEKAIEMGCRGYITKPFGPRDLVVAIRKYARERAD